MSKKNKYIGLLLAIIAVGLAVFSKTVELKADTPMPRIVDTKPTPWVNDLSVTSGKLKYGFTPNDALNNSTPNVEYVADLKNPTEVIRHLYDWRAYTFEGNPSSDPSKEKHAINSTVPFNIIETQAEYDASRMNAGVATIKNVGIGGDAKEIVGTGSKTNDSGLELSVSMKSNSNDSAVSHIYTITNNTGMDKTIYPHKSVDTQLNYDDFVPVYSRGKGEGLYIEGKLPDEFPNRPGYKSYRLDYITNVENGPKYYVASTQASRFSSDGTDHTNESTKKRNVFGPDLNNQYTPHVESQMTAIAGTQLYPTGVVDKSDDTAMFMSWGKVELKNGETFTMRYDVGIRPLAELEKTKTAENLTSKDGKNRVGDTIEYTITMKSPELAYKNLQVTDVLSEFFEHPTEDVTVTDVIGVNGNKTSYPIADVYNPTTRTLTVPKTGDEGLKIIREGKIELKFKVKLGANAAGKDIMNTASVVGKTEEETTVTEEVTTEDPLPVENARPVTIKHVDMNGNPLVPAIADEIKTGNLGQVITIIPTPLNGYAYDHASIPDPLKVTISTTDQEVLLYYSENRFTIKQEAVKADNSSATGVKVEEDINYTVTVESKLDASSTYKDFTISGKVTGVIENVDGFKLVSSLNPGVELAKPIYNPATGEFVATVQESDNVPSNANLIVTYTGKVEANAEPGDKITAEAKASGDYVNGLVATEIKATDFVSTVTAGQLIFESAPANMSFGENLGISLTNQDYPLANNDAPLSVKDLRGSNNQWSMVARVTKVLTNSSKGNHELPNALYYKKAGSNNLLEFEKDFIVTSHTTTSTGVVDISQTWNNPDDRPFVKVKGGEAKNGAYGGKIQWTLRNGL